MRVIRLFIFILLAVLITGCANGNVNPTTTPANTDMMEETPVTSTPESSPKPSPTPTLPLTGLKICIDAGHQSRENRDKEPLAPWNDNLKSKVTVGAEGVVSKIAEYVINLQISQRLKQKLVELGAEVLMIRETHDVNISNKERAEMANEFGAHLTLRIHCNSVASAEVNGIEIYMRDKGDGSSKHNNLASVEFQLANELMTSLVEITGAKNRNVRKSDDYTGINWSNVPCLIVECGYLSNAEEEALLIDEEYQDKITIGILNFIKETKLLKY